MAAEDDATRDAFREEVAGAGAVAWHVELARREHCYLRRRESRLVDGEALLAGREERRENPRGGVPKISVDLPPREVFRLEAEEVVLPEGAEAEEVWANTNCPYYAQVPYHRQSSCF